MTAPINIAGSAATYKNMEQINAEILKWIKAKIEQTRKENQIIDKLRFTAFLSGISKTDNFD